MDGTGAGDDGTSAGRNPPAPLLPYVPALDGVRGVAVLAVVGFHGGVSWLGGGFLGVSTFFTLSGFLISSLLLGEAQQRLAGGAVGAIGLRAFWTRRIRRLVPASLAGLILAVVVAAAVGTADQQRRIGGDAAGALADVANWRFLVSGQSYGELFAAPSPLLHYWSLAIEEQFYLVLPVLVLTLMAVAARRPQVRVARRAIAAFTVLLAASVVATLAHADQPDRVYYGTDTRAAELLAGCLLAAVIHAGGGVTRLRRSAAWLRVGLASVAVGALVATLLAFSLVEQSSSRLASGGLALFGLCSAALIAGALVPGPVAGLLSLPPLVRLGRVSYGVYVYHWPLFLWLDRDRVPLDPGALLALRLAVTLLVAAVSFRYLEQPVRRRQRLPWLPVPSRYPAVATALAVLVVATRLSALAPPPAIDYEAQEQMFQDELLAEDPAVEPTDLGERPPLTDGTLPGVTLGTAPVGTTVRTGSGGAVVPGEEAPPPWIAVYGDRNASVSTYELLTQLNGSADAHFAEGSVAPLCSLLRHTLVRDVAGVHANEPACDNRSDVWRKARDAARADVAVVQLGAQELYAHDLGGGSWHTIGDPEFDARVAAELDDVIGFFTDSAAVMLFALPTDWDALGATRPWLLDAGTYSVRAQRFNELLREAAARHAPRTSVFDFDAWLAANGGPWRLRPNGVKLDPGTSAKLATAIAKDAIALHDVVWRATLPTPDPGAAGNGAAPPSTQRILVAGDSTGLAVAVGLHNFADQRGGMKVASVARSNCGLVRGGRLLDKNAETDYRCPNWQPIFDDAVKRFRPDVVLVVDAIWEITDHQIPGDTVWRSVGDPVYERYLMAELGAAFDTLHAGGATVAVMLYPHIDLNRGDPGSKPYPGGQWSRMDRYNEILRRIAAGRPFMRTVDFQSYARTFPGGEMDATMRPDGVHLTSSSAFQVVDSWLAAQLRAL